MSFKKTLLYANFFAHIYWILVNCSEHGGRAGHSVSVANLFVKKMQRCYILVIRSFTILTKFSLQITQNVTVKLGSHNLYNYVRLYW